MEGSIGSIQCFRASDGPATIVATEIDLPSSLAHLEDDTAEVIDGRPLTRFISPQARFSDLCPLTLARRREELRLTCSANAATIAGYAFNVQDHTPFLATAAPPAA